MRISLSTIKAGQVFSVLHIPEENDPRITRNQFERNVIEWAHQFFAVPLSIFTAVEADLYSMVVILDINNGHEAAQQVLDI